MINGTEIDDDSVMTIAYGARLTFGGVSFYFVCNDLDRVWKLLDRRRHSPDDEKKPTDVRVRGRAVDGRRIELLSYGRPEVGGVLKLGSATIELPALEFEFVERLIEHAARQAAEHWPALGGPTWDCRTAPTWDRRTASTWYFGDASRVAPI
jgi:hypothetical protein